MQIEAIWYYLSLGTSAADPPGMQSIDTKLSVADQARTYRGRHGAGGYRDIAVGFPEKLTGQRQVHGETPQFAFSISRLGASPGSDIFAVKTGASVGCFVCKACE